MWHKIHISAVHLEVPTSSWSCRTVRTRQQTPTISHGDEKTQEQIIIFERSHNRRLRSLTSMRIFGNCGNKNCHSYYQLLDVTSIFSVNWDVGFWRVKVPRDLELFLFLAQLADRCIIHYTLHIWAQVLRRFFVFVRHIHSLLVSPAMSIKVCHISPEMRQTTGWQTWSPILWAGRATLSCWLHSTSPGWVYVSLSEAGLHRRKRHDDVLLCFFPIEIANN